MFLVLLRHGEKLISMDADVGLSAQGEKQADRLLEQVQAGLLPMPTRLFSSPKRRAVATLEPLANGLGLQLEIAHQLDERMSFETHVEFQARIERFIASLSTGSVYCCSHADWLYEAVTTLASDLIDPENEAHFSCSQARVFELEQGLWHLQKGST